jgi:uncharacterized protein YbcV (DUF1398 family)
MNADVIREVLAETQAGKLTFPEVVRRLLDAGVESYFCDFAVRPPAPIAAEFSPTEVVAAIRGAQEDTIRYPEFAKRSVAAGVIAYWAFLTGKRVMYFGRKGEFRIEEFPRPKL